jgi:hypothetical protein
LHDPETSLHDPETSLRDPETSLRDPETSLRDPEMSLRDPEMSLRDPEMSLRDRPLPSLTPDMPANTADLLGAPRREIALNKEYAVPSTPKEFANSSPGLRSGNAGAKDSPLASVSLKGLVNLNPAPYFAPLALFKKEREINRPRHNADERSVGTCPKSPRPGSRQL